jgi:CspA family cold shock protein
MATGTITTLLANKGYGFIRPDEAPDGSSDLFFHQSAVIDELFDDLAVGQRVEYTDEPDPRNVGRSRALTVVATDA